MIRNGELLHYSVELVRLALEREELHNKLVLHTASLEDYEVQLFKLCVLEFNHEVTFIKERKYLLTKVHDESYCDGVYSVVSTGVITFYDCNDTPLIRLIINDDTMNDN